MISNGNQKIKESPLESPLNHPGIHLIDLLEYEYEFVTIGNFSGNFASSLIYNCNFWEKFMKTLKPYRSMVY